MSMDCFTISALVDEFMDALVGGRIQDIIDVDAMGLGLEIFAGGQRRYLYMSADPNSPRVHLTDGKLRRGLLKPTQLGYICRRHVEGGILVHVSQPDWERLLRLDIQAPEGDVSLIIELMPRRANVLLLRDGMILDCLNRVGPDDNRYRLSLPNHTYVLPPPIRGQIDPAHISIDDVEQILAEATKPAQQVRRLLPGRILGMSPLLAREVVFLASGDNNATVRETDCRALLNAYQDVVVPVLHREWQPGIGYDRGVAADFSVFPLSFVDWQAYDAVSAAITEFHGSISGVDAYKEAKKPVQDAIKESRSKLSAKQASLQQGLKDDRTLELLKQSGELILAYQYTLTDGQDTFTATYEPDQPDLNIGLNPAISPLENAQIYFRKYDKAKSALLAVPELIAETKVEQGFLAQLERDLATASNWMEIDEVIQHLQARGHWQGKKRNRIGGGRGKGPLRIVSRDGYVVWVGRNSRQNDKVTFKTANRQDLWLHARDVPGAHVIIRNDGRRISDALIAEAASVAAFYSQRQGDGRVLVDYTRVKYVKAIKGAGPGMVSYRNEQTITVEPQDETVLK